MKKIVAIAVTGIMVFSILAIFLASASNAAPTTTQPGDIAMPGSLVIATFDPDNMEPSTLELYKYLTNEFLEEFQPHSTTQAFQEDTSEQNKNIEAVQQYLAIQLEEAEVTIVVTPEGNEGYFMIPMLESEFETNIKLPLEAEEEMIAQTEYANTPIYAVYAGYSSNYYAYYSGYLIISDESAQLESLFDYYANCTSSCNPISSKSKYSKVESSFLDNSSFDLYVDMDLLDENLSASELEQLPLVSESIGLSLKDSDDGYEMKIYSSNDQSKLDTFDIDFDDINPISLLNYLPSEKPILLVDTTALESGWKIMGANPDYEYFIEEFDKEFSTDFPDEIQPSLSKEIAVLLQDSGQLIPSLTILTDASDSKEVIEPLLHTIMDGLWEIISEAADKMLGEFKAVYLGDTAQIFISSNYVEIGNSTLDNMVFEIQMNKSKNPYAVNLPKSLLTFKITLGITDDDLLLISTNPNIADEYGEGLQTNSDINTLLDDEPTSILFIDTANLARYTLDALTTLSTYTRSELVDLNELKTTVTRVSSAFSNISVTSKDTNSSSYSITEINIDTGDLEGTIADFGSLWDNDLSNIIENTATEYNDVKSDAWYTDDIYYLSTKGIIKGKGNGTYEPKDDVNRAEFVKLIMEVLEKQNHVQICSSVSCYTKTYQGMLENFQAKHGFIASVIQPIDYTYSQENRSTDYYFEDVPSYAWYERYMYSAYNLGLLDGISGGIDTKLAPTNEILRSDAAAILGNVGIAFLEMSPSSSNTNFTDVENGSLLAQNVNIVGALRIMEGTNATQFEPNEYLNRAEAAKILKKLYLLLQD